MPRPTFESQTKCSTPNNKERIREIHCMNWLRLLISYLLSIGVSSVIIFVLSRSLFCIVVCFFSSSYHCVLPLLLFVRKFIGILSRLGRFPLNSTCFDYKILEYYINVMCVQKKIILSLIAFAPVAYGTSCSKSARGIFKPVQTYRHMLSHKYTHSHMITLPYINMCIR